MNTETRRAASRTYHAKREAVGLKKVTVWLSADGRATLARLAPQFGSRDAVVELALLGMAEGNAE